MREQNDEKNNVNDMSHPSNLVYFTECNQHSEGMDKCYNKEK